MKLPNSHTPPKLLGLEAIRFACAFAVLVYHYKHFFYTDGASGHVDVSTMPLYGLFALFYRFGFYGVHIFWCISGFIFFWKYKDAVKEGAVGAGKFFQLRFSRLYPLHLLTLLLVAVLQYVYLGNHGEFFIYQNNDVRYFILQLFLATDWTTQTVGSFNGPIWSISVEVLVYLVFFCTLRFLGASSWINVLIVVACVLAKLNGLVNSVLDCLTFFYAGGLSALAYRKMQSSANKIRTDAAVAAFLCAACGVIVVTKIYWAEAFPYYFLLFAMPVILYLATRPLSISVQVERAITIAGNMTYSSYLIHFPLQLGLAILFSQAGIAVPYTASWFLLSYLAVTLVAAYLLFEHFEMPAQGRLRALARTPGRQPGV